MTIPLARTDLGERFSEAARLLWAAIEREGITFGEAARRADISSGQLSHYLYGDRIPSIEIANLIAAVWPEVAVPLWAVDPTRRFRPPAARRRAS